MLRSAGQIRGRSSGQIGWIGQIGRTLDGANTTRLHITLLPCYDTLYPAMPLPPVATLPNPQFPIPQSFPVPVSAQCHTLLPTTDDEYEYHPAPTMVATPPYPGWLVFPTSQMLRDYHVHTRTPSPQPPCCVCMAWKFYILLARVNG